MVRSRVGDDVHWTKIDRSSYVDERDAAVAAAAEGTRAPIPPLLSMTGTVHSQLGGLSCADRRSTRP